MAERMMMIGSEQKLDYLIVAERDGVALGIKAFMTGSRKYGMTFGMRIRAALLPSAPHEMKAKANSTGIDWNTIYPEFSFDRSDKTRASTMVLVGSGHMPWHSDELKAQTMAAGAEMVGFLIKRFEHDLVDNTDAIAFLESGWSAELDDLAQILPPHPELIPETLTAHYFKEMFDSAIDASVPVADAATEMTQPKPVKPNPFKVVGGKAYQEPEADVVDDDIEVIAPQDA